MAKFGDSPAKQLPQFWSDFSENLDLGSKYDKHSLETHAPVIFKVAKTPSEGELQLDIAMGYELEPIGFINLWHELQRNRMTSKTVFMF